MLAVVTTSGLLASRRCPAPHGILPRPTSALAVSLRSHDLPCWTVTSHLTPCCHPPTSTLGVDVATDPRAPRLAAVAESEDIIAKTGLSALHSSHCEPVSCPQGDTVVGNTSRRPD